MFELIAQQISFFQNQILQFSEISKTKVAQNSISHTQNKTGLKITKSFS
jgi:hypothetical protein